MKGIREIRPAAALAAVLIAALAIGPARADDVKKSRSRCGTSMPNGPRASKRDVRAS
jgi:hypothetical protein